MIFESLALVAFDRQMGLIRKNRDNPDALTLFQTTRDIFRLTFKLDFLEDYFDTHLQENEKNPQLQFGCGPENAEGKSGGAGKAA